MATSSETGDAGREPAAGVTGGGKRQGSSRLRPAVERAQSTTAQQPSELRDFLSKNGGLLGNISLMAGLATLLIAVLPKVRWIESYVHATAIAAAVLLMLEFYAQWPDEVQPHHVLRGSRPTGHSWRFTAFGWVITAFAATFVLWAIFARVGSLVPILSALLLFGIWRWLESRWPRARQWRWLGLLAALFLSEVVLTLLFPDKPTMLGDLTAWIRARFG